MFNKKRKFAIFLIAFLSIIILSTGIVIAEGDVTNTYVPLSPLPKIAGEGLLDTVDGATGLGDYLKNIYSIIIGLSAVLAVIMIIIGGIQYMTFEIVGKKEAAKDKITGALLGLVLVFSSWLFLNTINPNLTNFILDIKEIKLTSLTVTTPGFYYEIAVSEENPSGGFRGPYKGDTAEEDCNAERLRKGDSISECEYIGPTEGDVVDQIFLGKGNYIDTTQKVFDKIFVLEDGPGYYFSYYGKGDAKNTTKISTQYTSAEMCENGMLSKNKELYYFGESTSSSEEVPCYLVEIGPNDALLSKIMDPNTSGNEAEIRSFFKRNQIGINNAACFNIGEENCTNVGGLHTNTLENIKKIRKECQTLATASSATCTVTITGGTEWWSHGNREKMYFQKGYRNVNGTSDGWSFNPTSHVMTFADLSKGRTVDLRYSDYYLTQYIKNKATKKEEKGSDGQIYISSGDGTLPKGTYLAEETKENGVSTGTVSHWHIEFE